ncbi:ataxin-2 homolog [Macrosteles quadrilineatus]|uniref:ataxin-2 homolog n=1 Tax=Macrosteles quadrilineatus TaxID=74068 RepID=UPI0023E188A8|nr:ataxin-2 homolog [Macrosteles quadrilineatus]
MSHQENNQGRQQQNQELQQQQQDPQQQAQQQQQPNLYLAHFHPYEVYYNRVHRTRHTVQSGFISSTSRTPYDVTWYKAQTVYAPSNTLNGAAQDPRGVTFNTCEWSTRETPEGTPRIVTNEAADVYVLAFAELLTREASLEGRPIGTLRWSVKISSVLRRRQFDREDTGSL